MNGQWLFTECKDMLTDKPMVQWLFTSDSLFLLWCETILLCECIYTITPSRSCFSLLFLCLRSTSAYFMRFQPFYQNIQLVLEIPAMTFFFFLPVPYTFWDISLFLNFCFSPIENECGYLQILDYLCLLWYLSHYALRILSWIWRFMLWLAFLLIAYAWRFQFI